jgi:hypothetical protein
MMALQVVDLFPDPPIVGGNAVVPPLSRFPAELEVDPSDQSFSKATLTPFPTFVEVVSSPLQPVDIAAGFLLGIALLLGPDFLLAPAGLVPDKGIRPGHALQQTVGALVDPDGQWLRDQREGLKSDAPLSVQLPVVAAFLGAGLALERLLLFSFEDASFVVAIGVCSVFGGGLLEVIRDPLSTREERELQETRREEFLVFAAENLERGALFLWAVFLAVYCCVLCSRASTQPALPCQGLYGPMFPPVFPPAFTVWVAVAASALPASWRPRARMVSASHPSSPASHKPWRAILGTFAASAPLPCRARIEHAI